MRSGWSTTALTTSWVTGRGGWRLTGATQREWWRALTRRPFNRRGIGTRRPGAERRIRRGDDTSRQPLVHLLWRRRETDRRRRGFGNSQVLTAGLPRA